MVCWTQILLLNSMTGVFAAHGDNPAAAAMLNDMARNNPDNAAGAAMLNDVVHNNHARGGIFTDNRVLDGQKNLLAHNRQVAFRAHGEDLRETERHQKAKGAEPAAYKSFPKAEEAMDITPDRHSSTTSDSQSSTSGWNSGAASNWNPPATSGSNFNSAASGWNSNAATSDWQSAQSNWKS